MKIKSLIVSDIHLGNPNSQADKLLKVFKKYEFENLFIVGDFIDMTFMKRKFYWNQSHSNVIQKVLKYSKNNVNVVYLTGNHDYYVRSLIEEGNICLGNIQIVNEYFYTTLKNEKIYLVHGDIFDGIIKTNKFLYWIGDLAYEFSIFINKYFNKIRMLFGYEYWSLSAYLKTKVKIVVKFLTDYKTIALNHLKNKDCDSIIQGHTHSPEISNIDNYTFYNSGDFVESCSYLIEDLEGNISLEYCKKEED